MDFVQKGFEASYKNAHNTIILNKKFEDIKIEQRRVGEMCYSSVHCKKEN